jgi:hypothetical protein
MKPRKRKNQDRRFGKLVCVEYIRHNVWLCRCDCGALVEQNATAFYHYLKGARKSELSCGCSSPRQVDWNQPKLCLYLYKGDTRKIYSIWRSAKDRCFNKKNPAYGAYGGRGITMCERWRTSAKAFIEDMGERPPGTSIDRYPDNDGNYEPGNCRWATP